MKLLDGKTLSLELQTEIAAEVQAHIANGGRKPHLAAILIGDDPASKAYVGHKVKACAKAGFKSSLIERKENISQADLLEIVRALNEDDSVDGFIVQLPLPSHIDNQAVIEAVKPSKDVDGFHPENVGRMSLGLPTFLPATPGGVMTLLERNG